MRDPVKGHEVVLTGAVHLNIAHDNEFFVPDIEGGGQDFVCGHLQAAEDLAISTGHARRGITQTFALWVLTDRHQQIMNCAFYPGRVIGPYAIVSG